MHFQRESTALSQISLISSDAKTQVKVVKVKIDQEKMYLF